MAGVRDGALARSIGALYGSGASGGLADAMLLERASGGRGEASASAFEAIVARHGPMVLGVCRRALDDPHDAQDAFQATFLVLARRARSIRDGDALASWLFGVARRVCDRARTDLARRRLHERRAAERMRSSEQDDDRRDYAALHEEVARLPEHYRLPVVLCYLEGLTYEAAADRLRCPLGTLSIRLSRARDRLRSRLLRRGLTASAGLLSVAGTASADVPEALAAEASRMARRFLETPSVVAGAVPESVGRLAQGVLDAMKTHTRLKAVAILGLAAVVAGGAVAWGALGRPDGPGPGAAPAAENPVDDDLAKLQGTWINEVSVPPSRLTFRGANYTCTLEDNTVRLGRGTVTIHTKATPRQIDLANEGGFHTFGTYILEGDTLNLYLSNFGASRGDPKPKLHDLRGGGTVWKRQRPTGDLAKLQGTWDWVSLRSPNVKAIRWEIGGSSLTMVEDRTDGVVSRQTAEIRLDERATPRAIDTVLDIPTGTITERGIYKIEGDTLTVCIGRKIERRPAEFRNADGDVPARLCVLRRRDDREPPAAGDLGKIQGAWVQVDPGALNTEHLSATWVFAGTKLTRHSKDASGSESEDVGEVRLDERAAPPAIDVIERATIAPGGGEREVVARCLYKVEGDTLTLCGRRGMDQPRPETFGEEGSITTVLRRPAKGEAPGKPTAPRVPPAAPAAVRGDLATLQGTWVSGAEGPRGAVTLALAFAGDTATSSSTGPSGSSRLGLKVKLDESASPRRIETETIGPKPTRLIGIYKIEGDTCTIHMATPDKPWPTDFEPEPENDAAVLAFRRKPGS